MIRRHLQPRALFIALAAVMPGVSLAQGGQRGAPPASSAQAPTSATQRRALLADPTRPFWKTQAPATFTAEMETSRGTITMEFTRAWAPNGVDHFYNLARSGYYDDTRFFRVLFGFVAQFGIAADPAAANLWGSRTIPADSVRERNVRGTISYAQFKPTDRTTNVFINLRDNSNLDTLGFAPIGRVTAGMDVADSLFANYGELPISEPPLGDPKRLYGETNKFLDEKFPKLDRILKITVRPETPAPAPPPTSPR